MKITEWSIRRPVAVCVGILALIVLGAVSITRLPLEFFPQKDLPFVGVFVPYPNAVPSQVEWEIARPIEEVLATLGDIKQFFSESQSEYAFVGVLFAFGRNVDVLRLEVKEKLDQVRPLLPSDVRDLFVFTFNTNDIPVMIGRISAKGGDLSSSYDLLDRRIVQRLKRIEGVGRVQIGGVLPAEISIYLLIDKILEHRVDVEQLFQRLYSSNLNLTVGRTTMEGDRYAIRVLSEFQDIDEIKNLVVDESGLQLADVAEIIYDEPLPSYRRRLNGEPAVAFEIQRGSGANIVDLSRRVHAELDEIREDPLLEDIDVVIFLDQAEQITNSLGSLLKAGIAGSILALGVLFFFLRRLTTTLIVLVAIPFSIISTCVFLYLTGRTLNVLTMMGLMLATGMLVDNAIVVLESIHRRHMRGENAADAARIGTQEVGRAVIAATLTSICVFAPVVLTPNSMISVWLGEVGHTIIVALSFSLLISLTLVPLMMSRLSRATRHTVENGSEKLSRSIVAARERYKIILQWTAIRHPVAPLGIVLVLCGATIGGCAALGVKPEPESERGEKQDELWVEVVFEDNFNLYAVEEYVDRLETYLLAVKDSLGFESVYTYYADNALYSSLVFGDLVMSESEIRDLRQHLRKGLPPLPGCRYVLARDEEEAAGIERISVTLFGEDTEYLAELAEEVKRRFQLVEGLEDVETALDRGREEVQVSLRREDAGRFGITPASIAQVLNLTFRGVPLGQFKGPDREIEMGIVLEPSDRRNIENLKSMVVSRIDGQDILLGQVADFRIARGPTRIYRENRKTALGIRASYEGEKFGKVRDRVETIMNSMELPEGYSWSFGRQMREEEEEMGQLMINIVLALACVFFVMASLFESLLHPFVIMFCIPFAGLGVAWMSMLTGTPINILAMIGIVILIGIVVNNGIILVDHINNYRRAGRSREEAILLGGEERFRPILMTALTTILGLVPLAVGKADIAGGYYFPMARAVMGGLLASTALTLVILPTFYVLAERSLLWVRRIGWRARGRL